MHTPPSSLGGTGRERDHRADLRPAAGRALHPEPPVEHGEAVAEPDVAAAVGAHAAHPVVADVHAQRAVVHPRDHLGVVGAREDLGLRGRA